MHLCKLTLVLQINKLKMNNIYILILYICILTLTKINKCFKIVSGWDPLHRSRGKIWISILCDIYSFGGAGETNTLTIECWHQKCDAAHPKLLTLVLKKCADHVAAYESGIMQYPRFVKWRWGMLRTLQQSRFKFMH